MRAVIALSMAVLCRHFRVLLVALLAGCAVATASAQGLSLRYHGQSDGLSNLAVTALVQMPDGRLWIGTENGLYRHDGSRIVRIDGDLPAGSRHVSALAADGSGGLWIGSKNGILHLGKDGIQPVESAAGVRIVVRQGQTIAGLSDGGALVAAMDGLYAVHRDGGVWRADLAIPQDMREAMPALATIHAVLVDPDGTRWLGCDRALCRWRAEALQFFGEREGVSPSPWARLLRTSDGALWARSQTQVLRRAAGLNAFDDVTPPGLSHGVVHLHQPLAEDSDGRVMTLSDTGLLRWKAGRWEMLGASQGLAIGGGVHSILVDRNQDVWLGTAGLGLVHWRGYGHWRQWTQLQGLSSEVVWSFAEEGSSRMWMGTSNGIAVLTRDTVGARVVPQSGTHAQVGSITRDVAGQLWMATYSGELFRRDASGVWRRVAGGLPLVLLARPAMGGGLWLSTDKGLYFADVSRPNRVAPKLVVPPGMGSQEAASMTVFSACTLPAGQTWFATSVGLLVHDPALGLKQPSVHGLPASLTIDAIGCTRHGALWAASSDSRLWRIGGGMTEGWRVQEQIADTVLGQRSVMALLGDSRGWLWASTDDGVVVWNGRQWRRFDESNGLVWNDCSQNALYEDAAGDIWIGTSRGASQVVAPERLFEPVRAELRFTRITRDDQSLAPDQPWTAGWSAGALQIAWAVPTFTNRPAQQVRYRLRGLSEQWSTTRHDDVTFTALPAGRYIFEAQAENKDLGLATDIATLRFEILPPWWRSAWAILASGVGAATLVLLAHRWRVGLLVRRKRELEALVRQRTSELNVSYDQMRTLALADPLTEAMNRRAITELAARELARVRRGEASVAFVLVDVDHFKCVNDTYGHPAGDAVLVQLVQRLRGAMREYDAIGRWGGEEFLLVLPGLSLAQEDGRRRAESLQRCVAEQPFDIGTGTPLVVTCSAGVVPAPAGTEEPLETLVGRADAALYEAKRCGRNQTVFTA